MKKTLLAVLFACSLVASAQTRMIQKEASFDFHNYETLTPTVNFGNESVFAIGEVSYTAGDITFNDTRKGDWVVINQNIKPDYCGLQIPRTASFSISAAEGCELVKIDLKSMGFYNGVAGLVLDNTTNYGSYESGIWNCETYRDVTKVVINNPNGQSAELSGIKVTYLRPANILNYTTISPAIDEETDPFTGYTITFADSIILNNEAVFNVTDASSEVVAVLTPSVSGKVLTLTPDAPITKAGAYTLTIPEGAVSNVDTEYNGTIQATFTVKDYPDTFNYSAISLEPGLVKEIPASITMTFPGAIGTVPETAPALYEVSGDEPVVAATPVLSISQESADMLVLSFTEAVIATGTYRLTFPAESIKDQAGTHYNKEFVLNYQVVGYNVPSSEAKALADSLLNLTGVGYPKTQSAARLQLAEVVAGSDKTAEEYATAIAQFISTDDIVYPQYGKYYTFTKVPAAQSDTTYIGYAEEVFYVTTDADDAEHFLMIDVEGDRYVGMTDLSKSKVVLGKATNENPAAVLGLFTVSIDGFTEETAGLGYILTEVYSRDPKTTLTVNPVDEAQLESIEEITVMVNEVEQINYNEETPIVILKDGEAVDVIKSISVEGNVLTIQTAIYENGTYTLNIPEGAITFFSIDHDAKVKAFSATYEVSSNYAFSYDFTLHYSIFNLPDMKETYPAEKMNDISIFSNETELFINEEECATYILNSDGKTVFTGTLEKDPVSWTISGKSYLNFKFDTVFTKENMPDGTYTFVIKKGSFGDANFGAYLESPVVTEKPNCHLNGQLYWIYTVSSDTAGITSVDGNSQDAPVYDLQGRRVKSQSRGGLYISGGKKMIAR